MNSLQLSILLDKYSDSLWSALASIEAELPDELKEVAVNAVSPAKKGKLFAPVMQPLRDALFNLDYDAGLLRENARKERR